MSIYVTEFPEREIYKVVTSDKYDLEAYLNQITADDPEWTLEFFTDKYAVFVKTVPVEAPAQ